MRLANSHSVFPPDSRSALEISVVECKHFLDILNTKWPSFGIEKNIIVHGIAHPFLERKPDVLAAPQVPQVCCDFRNS